MHHQQILSLYLHSSQQTVIRFFTGALDSGPSALDEAAVRRGIEIALRSWRPAQLLPGTTLHFQYEEGTRDEIEVLHRAPVSVGGWPFLLL